MKRALPIFIASVIGTYMVLQYQTTAQTWLGRQMATVYQWFNDWYTIGWAMVIIVALGNMLRVHLNKVRKLSSGWAYSLLVLASLLIYCGLAFWPKYAIGEPNDWIFTNIYFPLDGTMFSLLAFFMASAAYRAFRIRNVEATIMLVTAALIMLGRVPIGSYISSRLPDLTTWLLSVPAMAAKRGIMFGVALGIIATSMKIILGIEKPYLGGGARS